MVVGLTANPRADTVRRGGINNVVRTLNLLVFPGHPTDATNFYRCDGPLHALRRRRPLQLTHLVQDIHWATISAGDAAFFQRPTTKNHLEIARMCARSGLPIWVEFDDDFFGLPEANPHYDDFMKPEVHDTIRKIVELADVVTVSTAELARVFGELHKDVRVVPNALMTNLVGHVPDHTGKARSNMVMWRGTKTHQVDIDAYEEQIIEASQANPTIQWAFQGYATNSVLKGIGPRAMRGGMIDTLEYFGAIAAVRPRALMVPLADHRFNRSKSNIAGIEATFAGAVPIVPDWPEWQVEGWLKYSDRASFLRQLTRACQMEFDEIENRHKAAANRIEATLTIDVVNAKRSRILDELESLSLTPKFRAAKRDKVWPKMRDGK